MAKASRQTPLILEDRARLSLNHLTRNLDPKLNYQPFFWTIFTSDPPEARHDFPDYGDMTGRYVDAIILIRRMLSTEIGEEEERRLKELLLSTFSEGDGLCYRPNSAWSSHDAPMFEQTSALFALVTWYIQTGDEKINGYIERIVEGLWKIAIKNEGYCYFPYEAYGPTGWDWNYDGGEGARNRPSDTAYDGGRLIIALVRYFERTHYPRAIELAKNLVNSNLYHSTSLQGRIFSDDGRFTYGHVHARTATIAGILKYGIVTGDKKLIAWSKKAYEYATTQVCSSFGWTAECDGRTGGELCGTADMIEIAIMLAEHEDPRYWNDVERYTRNHLIEAQLTDVSWVKSTIRREDTPQSSFNNVADRALGGFAGWAAPNAYFHPSCDDNVKFRMMNCCSAAGARALFLAWYHIVKKKDEAVFVNLSLDCNTEWVDIRSARPYTGQVKIRVHNAPTLLVRIPDWVRKNHVKLDVDGRTRKPVWDYNSYLKMTRLKNNQEVTVTYPVREKEEKETVGGKIYRLTWKGDTIMGISPRGKILPFYQNR